jgi:hypothetical protein
VLLPEEIENNKEEGNVKETVHTRYKPLTDRTIKLLNWPRDFKVTKEIVRDQGLIFF